MSARHNPRTVACPARSSVWPPAPKVEVEVKTFYIGEACSNCTEFGPTSLTDPRPKCFDKRSPYRNPLPSDICFFWSDPR